MTAHLQSQSHRALLGLGVALVALPASATQSDGWYTQGDFKPSERIEIRLTNDLDIDRPNTPVVITRDQIPALADIHDLTVTLVDPAGEARPEPSAAVLAVQGPHERRGEANGRAIDYQLDDLDKDGVWDELFLMADFKAGETKTLYIYRGFQQRGWNPHQTHAGIGSYMRHVVPFWESGNVGWKLWFPTDIDVFAKRETVLMAYHLYSGNLDGYGVAATDPAFGADIQSVDDSFGGGGIGVFEGDTLARPRFTPTSDLEHRFNGGQLSDTRYAFDVVVNGPLRSMVRVKIMNWNSGHGVYEAEQTYTAYAGQNYSTAKVRFTRFEPGAQGADFAVGIRKRPGENLFRQAPGMVITAAPERLRNPDDVEGLQENPPIAYAGTALVVKGAYSPDYVFIPERGENHVFRVPARADATYEYMIAAGWSEGQVLRTAESFADYVAVSARGYNSPIRLVGTTSEIR